MKKLSLFFCICAVASAGCTLDEVYDRSDTKCSAEYAVIDASLTCYLNAKEGVSECSPNVTAMVNGFCPLNLDVCAVDAEGRNYCHKKCDEGRVFCGAECIDPMTDMFWCGAKKEGGCFDESSESADYKGSQCASGTVCTNGKCHSSQGCSNNEHEDETGICVENTTEMCGTQSCVKLPGWANGICNVNQCEASECKASYHLDAGKKQCEADTASCCGANCNDCGEGSCVRGRCVTGKACDLNQHLGRDNECEDDDLKNCGHVGYDCMAFGLQKGECIEGICVAESCKPSFHLIDNICVPDTSSCCGAECIDCGGNACVNGGCLSGSCATGAHSDPKGNCVPDSVNACGRHDYDCATIPGWKNGDCVQARCEAAECTDDYHLDKQTKQCVANGNTCCGEDCIQCKANERCIDAVCSVNSCNPGEALCQSAKGSECRNVADDNNNCGSCDHICTSFPSASHQCLNQKCVYTCNPGLAQCGSEEAPNCIDVQGNDSEHCGSCTHRCSDKEYCSEGNCLPRECNLGQHKNAAGKCIDDSPTECGSITNNCNNVVFDAEVVECRNGQCYASKCSSGFHLTDDKRTCEADTPERCGSSSNSCYDIPNRASVKCEKGTCIVESCNQKYHVNASKSACELNSDSACGSYDVKCIDTVAEDYSCNVNTGKCEFTCNSGYHKLSSSSSYCAKDTITECGRTAKNCKNLPGWQKGACFDGYCVAVACKSPFFLSGDGICVESTRTNCGAYGINCSDISMNNTNNSNICGVDSQYFMACLPNCDDLYSIESVLEQFYCIDDYHGSTWRTQCEIVRHQACGTRPGGRVCLESQYLGLNGYCYDLDTENCGFEGYDCDDNTPGAEETECIGLISQRAVCSAKSCSEGYEKTAVKLYNKQFYRCKPTFAVE